MAGINGVSQKLTIALESRIKERVTTTEVKMPLKGHFRGKIIIGLEGVSVVLKLGNQITMGILTKHGIIIHITGGIL